MKNFDKKNIVHDENDMLNKPSDTEKKSNSGLLAFCSLMLYLLSLILPGFEERAEGFGFPGFLILIFGLLGGWACSPAPYANLFYYYVFFKKRSDKKPYISTAIMLLLTSTIVFFPGTPRISTSGFNQIVNWGWGAVVWVMAIILLALAVFFREKNCKQQLVMLLVVLSVTIVPICFYRAFQYSQANSQERENYLPLLAAFTTHEMSGVPYNPPPTLDIHKDTVIELIGSDLSTRKHYINDGNFSTRIPNKFQYRSEFWRVYEKGTKDYVALVDAPKSVDYYYGIEHVDEKNARIFILNSHKQSIWQAPIVITNSESQYPDYDGDNSFAHFKPLENHVSDIIDKDTLPNETATQTCTITQHDNSNPDDKLRRFTLNNQLIEVGEKYGEVQNTAFCSEHFVFIFTIREQSLYIIAFHKKTMVPLYIFYPYKRKHGEIFVEFLKDFQESNSFSALEKIEFIPHVPNTKKKGRSNSKPAKIRLQTKYGDLIISPNKYF